MTPQLTVSQMIARYEVLFFDAYGVLVDAQEALPGACELIAHLNRIHKPYFILTNDASRLISTSASRYQRLGLAIEADHVITSGSLLAPFIAQAGLGGAATLLLGTPDSRTYALEAGLDLMPLAHDAALEVFVLGDLSQRAWEDMERVVSALINRIESGHRPRLILPNPDLLYPKSAGQFGITAGGAAAMIETILRERYGQEAPAFERLGKPHRFIYEEGLRRSGAARHQALMIGDQLATDVRGAMEVGIDAALVTGGLTSQAMQLAIRAFSPTWLLPSYAL